MSASPDSILKLEVPLIVQIASRRMPLSEILRLQHGSIVEFPKPTEDDLEILVNNKRVGTGTAVKVGENFGIRVRSVGPLRARAAAMGVDPAAAADSAADLDAERLASQFLDGS